MGTFIVWDGVNNKLITTGISLSGLDSRYINTTGGTINGDLIVTGKTTLNIVVDSNGFTGNTNDTLVSTSSGVTWVNSSSTIKFKTEPAINKGLWK